MFVLSLQSQFSRLLPLKNYYNKKINKYKQIIWGTYQKQYIHTQSYNTATHHVAV